MQILDRTATHIVVELTTEEATQLGASLHLYHGASLLYNKPTTTWIPTLANALLWHRTYAALLARHPHSRWD